MARRHSQVDSRRAIAPRAPAIVPSQPVDARTEFAKTFERLMDAAKVPEVNRQALFKQLEELRNAFPGDTPSAVFQRARSQGSLIPPVRCVHGIKWGECVVCDARLGERFYFTGGGTHVHSTPLCKALAEGQEKVRRRGGNPEPIEVVTRYGDHLDRRDACKVCLRRAAASSGMTTVSMSAVQKASARHVTLTTRNAPGPGGRLYWGGISGTVVYRSVAGLHIAVGGSTMFVRWGDLVRFEP